MVVATTAASYVGLSFWTNWFVEFAVLFLGPIPLAYWLLSRHYEGLRRIKPGLRWAWVIFTYVLLASLLLQVLLSGPLGTGMIAFALGMGILSYFFPMAGHDVFEIAM